MTKETAMTWLIVSIFGFVGSLWILYYRWDEVMRIYG